MHPQIQLPEFGPCPICGMDLIPVPSSAGGDDHGPTVLELGEAAVRRARVRTAVVERREATALVHLTGMVAVDEARRRSITARVPGRLERLHVDVPGVRIGRGDRLVEIYSPQLATAQQELLQSLSAQRRGGDLMAEMNVGTLEAARGKLRLLGLTPGQIERLEASGEVQETITLYSPIDGIVLEKPAVEGEYVKTGDVIYELADLSGLWVLMDAYESDLQWLRPGQTVEFEAQALPGEPLRGIVSLVDPVLDPQRQTAKVRVNVANPGGRLKPGMFVGARVQTTAAGDPGKLPLVIPTGAPLITGQRAVVYVELEHADGTHLYEGREVLLGPRVTGGYIVLEGVAEGERVVVEGAFRLDAELQIRGRPSMMNPADEGAPAAPVTGHENMPGHGR